MKNRLITLSFLFSIYFAVAIVDYGIEYFSFLNKNSTSTQVITKLHFQQRHDSPIHPEYFEKFLTVITENGSESKFTSSCYFLSILLVVYLLLAVIVFTKLFTHRRI